MEHLVKLQALAKQRSYVYFYLIQDGCAKLLITWYLIQTTCNVTDPANANQTKKAAHW